MIRGEEKVYLTLDVTQGDLVIEVPADNVDLVGMRDVIGHDGVGAVFAVLASPVDGEPTNWSRRYNANVDKRATRDIVNVAEVVRDLWRRDRARGLSAGEKHLLAKARQVLVSELALAEHSDEEQAITVLDRALRA
jgi:CarD family transcriptional regulator